MNRIFKYKVVHGQTILLLPKNSKLLSVVEQYGLPVLYAMVNDEQESMEEIVVRSFSTGAQIPEEIANNFDYLGTCLLDNQTYVIHFFYLKSA